MCAYNVMCMVLLLCACVCALVMLLHVRVESYTVFESNRYSYHHLKIETTIHMNGHALGQTRFSMPETEVIY